MNKLTIPLILALAFSASVAPEVVSLAPRAGSSATAAGTPTSFDDCGIRCYCDCDWQIGDHTVVDSFLGFGEDTTGKHDDCRICAVGNCGHESCNPMEDRDLQDELIDALLREDLPGATPLFIALQAEGGAYLNRERGLLQLLSCEGAVAGQVPVSPALFAELETLSQ